MEFRDNREIKHCLVKRTNKHTGMSAHAPHYFSLPCEHTHAHENTKGVHSYLGLGVNFVHT